MVDVTLRSIYSAADETAADLDRLLSASALQRSQNLRRLENMVSGLGHSDVDTPEAPQERHERPPDRRPPTPDPQPFVALPQRTTHGGPFGPVVREKLTRIALEKSRW
jgi:hypothetical protein